MYENRVLGLLYRIGRDYRRMKMIDKLFDLDELICIFKRRFWIIIVVTLALNSLATYKVSKYKPRYVASMQIFMGDKDNMFKVYSEEQMQAFSDFFLVI